MGKILRYAQNDRLGTRTQTVHIQNHSHIILRNKAAKKLEISSKTFQMP